MQTGRRLCGCDRAGDLRDDASVPVHADTAGLYQKTAVRSVCHRAGAGSGNQRTGWDRNQQKGGGADRKDRIIANHYLVIQGKNPAESGGDGNPYAEYQYRLVWRIWFLSGHTACKGNRKVRGVLEMTKKNGNMKIKKRVWSNQKGSGVPLSVAMVCVVLLLFCLISEYIRLQIIVSGVRDAVEDAVISVVNDNYAGVYHGVREGYSGGYLPYGDGAWEETLDEGDVYGHLAETLGLQRSGGKYVKYLGGNRNRLEYAIDRLSVSIRNAPLAPSDPKSAQRFEADAILRMEVPVRFSGRILPSLVLNLKVQAGYTEVF